MPVTEKAERAAERVFANPNYENPEEGPGVFYDGDGYEWSHVITGLKAAGDKALFFGDCRPNAEIGWMPKPLEKIGIQIMDELVFLPRHEAREFAQAILGLCGEEVTTCR